MMPPITYDAELLAEVCRREDVRLVVLFGSHAGAGRWPHEDSDLDIAVSLKRVPTLEAWAALHASLSDVFRGFEIDLAVIGAADPLFRWEIMRDGILLFGDELEFLELRAFSYRDFVDSADLRALEQGLFEKKLTALERLANAPA
jgi:predicted nucleotidyltransferase